MYNAADDDVEDDLTDRESDITPTGRSGPETKENAKSFVVPINDGVVPARTMTLPLESVHAPSTANIPAVGGQEGFCEKINISKLTDNPVTAFVVKNVTGVPKRMMDGINAGTYYVADSMCGAFAKTRHAGDVTVIQSQLKIVLALSVAFYVIYNWFFVMFYRDGGQRVKIPNLSSESIKNWSKLFHLVFKYNLSLMSTLDNVLMHSMPPVVETFIPSRQWIFGIMLFIIVGVMLGQGEGMVTAFTTYLRGQQDQNTGSYIAFKIMFGFASMFAPVGLVGGVQRAMQYMYLGIPTLILFVMRVTWSSAIAWLTGLMAVGYLIVMSFFAILMYSNRGLFDTIADINRYVFRSGERSGGGSSGGDDGTNGVCNRLDETGPCNPPTLFGRLKTVLNWLRWRSMRYVFEMILFFSLIAAITAYSQQLQDGQLKDVMCGTAGGMAMIIVVWLVSRMYNGGKLLWGGGEVDAPPISDIAKAAMKSSCFPTTGLTQTKDGTQSGLVNGVMGGLVSGMTGVPNDGAMGGLVNGVMGGITKDGAKNGAKNGAKDGGEPANLAQELGQGLLKMGSAFGLGTEDTKVGIGSGTQPSTPIPVTIVSMSPPSLTAAAVPKSLPTAVLPPANTQKSSGGP